MIVTKSVWPATVDDISLLAALRRLLAAGPWLSLAADVAFGVGAAVIFCSALVTADYGRVRLFSIAGALTGFALCAGGLFPPARRVTTVVGRMFRHIFVKFRSFRWIKVIFR